VANIKFYDGPLSDLLNGPQGPVAKYLAKLGVKGEGIAKRLCPTHHGRLRASVTWREGKEASGLVLYIGTNLAYARWVEFGTRPHWPPPGALDEWARAHGIPSGYLVARKISRSGTPPQPFLRPMLRQLR
jgi:hypothetical protein